MNIGLSAGRSTTYQVATELYEGPLDLLLQLIERAELDITKLALAKVTDQYLQHLHRLTEHAPDEVSAFLVIAARLIQIKSEALLPRPVIREPDEEDTGEALARQLIAYKRYRQIANLLDERHVAGLHTYLRLAPPPRIEGSVDLSDVSLMEFMTAAQTALGRKADLATLNSVVAPPKVTIREKIALITQLLGQRSRGTFKELIHSRPTRLDLIVTFLALLELVKMQLIQAAQEQLFGEITFEASNDWQDGVEIESEFGE